MRRGLLLWTAVLLLPGGCATPGPGDPGYPYNVDGAYRGAFTLDDLRLRGTVRMETRADGTVTGTLRLDEPYRVRGDFSGSIHADTLTWRSSYRVPSQGCAGLARGRGPVAPQGTRIGGALRIDDSCQGVLSGRFELVRTGESGR